MALIIYQGPNESASFVAHGETFVAARGVAIDVPADVLTALPSGWAPAPAPSVMNGSFGTHGARPAASAANANAIYYETDTGLAFMSDGANWNLFKTGDELGYAQITSNFAAGSAGPVDVTGLSVTVTVGVRPIMVIFDCSFVTTLTGAVKGVVISSILEDAVVVANAFNTLDANNDGASVHREVRRTPTPGAHTYKIQVQATGAGNFPEVSAGVTTPAFIQVREV